MLIAEVLKYWHKPKKPLPTIQIYLSFQCIKGYLETGNWKDSCYLGKQKSSEIISLTGGRKIPPKLFNSILITGKKYKLEHPYGVFPPRCTIDVGGICINRCTAKQSICHETVHLLGANDHYYEKHNPKNCQSPSDCYMHTILLKETAFATIVLRIYESLS